MNDSYSSTIAILVSLMAVVAAIETLAPLFPRSAAGRRHLPANLVLTTLTFSLTFFLGSLTLAGAAWIHAGGFGIFALVGVDGVAGAVAAVVALDLATYAAHRSMHAVPLLWRVHLVHHIDASVDVTTSFRQHPFETAYRSFVVAVAAWLLGASPASVLLYRTLSAVNAVFEHANVRMPRRLDSALSLGVVTPNMHKLHHSRARAETDSNFGNLFSTFDRIFATFTPSARAYSVRYGIDGYDDPDTQSLHGVLTLPLTARSRSVRFAREGMP